MRWRLRTGPAALFGALTLLALLVLLPMRVALGAIGLGEQGLSARSVAGSIWAGRLAEARIGELALGDLDARVSPLALLIGRARLSLSSVGGGSDTGLHGSLSVDRHAFGIDEMSATLAAGSLFQPMPVTALVLDAVSIHFRDGACEAASGQVRALLGGDAAGVPLPASVSGTARCDGPALLLPLTSLPGTEAVALRITADGRYHADLTLRPSDPAIAAKLSAAGFTATPAGYRLSADGSI